ncbi:MAG: hypothetical protein R3E96_12465 [Planctomycetota bacterium]
MGQPLLPYFGEDAWDRTRSGELGTEQTNAFTGAKDQQTMDIERQMDQGQGTLLCGRLQIDQEIPAANEIQSMEGRVPEQVVRCKGDHPTQGWNDLYLIGADRSEVLFDEPVRQT